MLKPLHNNVIIELTKEPALSERIYIPKNKDDKSNFGKVIAIGEGRRNMDGVLIPTTLKPGDHVYFSAYIGTEINFKGNSYICVSETDILLKIEA